MSLAFVRGIDRWPVNSPHKGPVTRKMFPFDDVIMITTICLIKCAAVSSCTVFCANCVITSCRFRWCIYLYTFESLHWHLGDCMVSNSERRNLSAHSHSTTRQGICRVCICWNVLWPFIAILFNQGLLFTKNTYGYRDSHYEPETVVRPSQVYNGIPIAIRRSFSEQRPWCHVGMW